MIVDMDKEILKRIEESKKDYDKKTQMAELLKRNKSFLNKLKGIKKRLGNKFFKVKELDIQKLTKISNDNILLKLDYPKVNFFISEVPLEEVDAAYSHYLYYREFDGYNPKAAIKEDSYFKNSYDLNTVLVYDEDLNTIRTKIICRFKVLRAYVERWMEFCARWHIDSSWDGNLLSLSKSLNPLVSININYKDLDLPIQINIGPWTSLKDIKQRWNEIELIKRTSFTKPKKSRIFDRDLCWYDLNKKFKLTPGEIAKVWNKYCPEEIDLLVIKRIKREEKRELSEEKASELLEEIRTDPTMNDLKIQLESEREFYIKGSYSPFVDLIKKAIKNMNLKVKEIGTTIKGGPLLPYVPLGKLEDYYYHSAEAYLDEKIDSVKLKKGEK